VVGWNDTSCGVEIMIIIKLMGGLGNQLQQYALYQKFIALGKEVYLDTAWFEADQSCLAAPRKLELDSFTHADYVKATAEQIETILGKDDFFSKLARKLHLVPNRHFYETQMYHPEIFDMDNVYLEGYWAANKYYDDVMDVVRGKLYFDINAQDKKILADNRAIAEKIMSHENTCSVHIRRGDYLDPVNAATFGGIATESYYDAAFSYVRETHPDTQFYIFSDDMEYVKKRYGSDSSCHFVDINHGADSRYDIYLMSVCNMHICANSTFSFWGSRLDSKSELNIRPSIHKNSQVFDADIMHDLWKGWVLIDPQGVVR